ncbi:MAG: hypothetical protein HC915_00275 [Anaerolineae bacterium]|nr:hypothetical protein [Anaerolineae bacterium]
MAALLFAEDAQRAYEQAIQAARQRHSPYLDVEHLLLGLLEVQTHEPLQTLLASVDRPAMMRVLTADLGMVRDTPLPGIQGVTSAVQKVFGAAAHQAEAMGHKVVNGGHLLLALGETPSEAVQGALRVAALDQQHVAQVTQERSPRQRVPGREIKLETAQARREARAKQAARRQDRQQAQNVPYTLVISLALAVLSVYLAVVQPEIFISFWIVLGGWILSVAVHEFAHAIVAYWGGDHTVRDKGYLTLNPFKYTHPLLSIGLPLLFLALGGIGLPGGAVYIEKNRLRNIWWRSAVSAAGPLGTAIMAVIFSAPFWMGYINPFEPPSRIWAALAFLTFLQVVAIFLNLLPIPPLDGYGIIEPFLPPNMAYQFRSIGLLGLFLVFFLFRVPAFAEPFFSNVLAVTDALEVIRGYIGDGLNWFRFWS